MQFPSSFFSLYDALLYRNSSLGLDTQDTQAGIKTRLTLHPSWDRNPPNFTLDLISYSSAISLTYDSLEN